MNTATLNLGMYEQSRDELMTKADGEKLRAEIQVAKAGLLETINNQTWKLISFVAVLNALLVAAMKWLPG